MNIRTIKYDKIDEMLHIYEHDSGLKAFVIPKKGYSKKYATFAAHYGSIDNKFVIPGEKEPTKVPDGIAHFLEHKLFEQEDGSVMDKFSALGAMPNAYTGFSQTVYLFSCTEKFEENFRLLMDFVQNPHITDESVEKEKGIIGQEIRMYQDDPSWRVFFNLLRSFYLNSPVKVDIAGTLESIGKINREILYKCYNTFYHPSNMIILVVGDVEPAMVFSMVRDSIKKTDAKPEIKRIFQEEPLHVCKNYTEQRLAVSLPLFQAGFKDPIHSAYGKESIMREVSVKILLEMIMGRSTELYNNLYSEGLINHTFDFDYTIEASYAFSIFGGESVKPEKVADIISKHIRRLHLDGLDKRSYERAKKALYGRFVRQLNSVEKVSHTFISVCFRKVNLFDYLDVYDKISFEYVKLIFEDHFNLDRIALSVIKPF